MNLSLNQSTTNKLRPNERSLAIFLTGLAFFYGLTVVFANTSATALFLTAFSADQLPVIYVISAFIISLTGFLNLRITIRQSPRNLFLIIFCGLGLLGIGLRLGIMGPDSPALIFSLLIWFRLLYALCGYIFWGTANQLLTLSQGKRLLGRISAGQTIANILGYAIVPFILSFTITENLITLSIISLFIMLGLMLLAFRSGSRSDLNNPLAFQDELEEFKPAKDRYLRAILFITFFSYLIYFLVDFAFYSELSNRYTTAESLAVFISWFYMIAHLGTFISRSFLTASLLRRLGIKRSLMIFPVALSVITLMFLSVDFLSMMSASFVLILGVKFFDEILHKGIVRPAFPLFYQPFTQKKKILIQTINDIVVIPLGIGVGGLSIILARTAGVASGTLLALTIVVSIIMVFVIRRAFFGYKESLRRALSLRAISARSLNLNDAETLAIVEQKLSSKHAGEVVYAIELLSRENKFDVLNLALKGLLYHPDPILRSQVARQISSFNMTPLIPFLKKRFEIEDNPLVQRTLLEAMGQLGGPDTIEQLLHLLEHGNDHIRFAAMVGLLQSGISESREALSNRLEDLVVSQHPRDRLLAARVMGTVGSPNHESHLLLLLHDAEPAVICEALLSIGKLQQSQSIALIFDFLEQPIYRHHVLEALLLAGDAALPAVEKAIEDDRLSHTSKGLLFHACGLMDSPQAAYLLQKNLIQPDLEIREIILESLARIGYRITPKTRPALVELIQDEIMNYATLISAEREIDPFEPPVLISALQIAQVQCCRRHNLALSIYYHSTALLNATNLIIQGNSSQQSQARELLELTIDHEIHPHALTIATRSRERGRLSKLLEAYPVESRPTLEWLKTIIAAKNGSGGITPWLKASTLYTIGLNYLESALPDELDIKPTESAVVAETVQWAKIRLSNNGQPTRGENQMLLLIEKVMTLKSADVFSEIPEQTLSAVAEKTSEKRLRAGERLFEKGELGSSMFVIVSGRLRVFDEDHTLNYLEERAVVGEMALLDPAPRSASVEAAEDTLLLELTSEMLDLLIARDSTVAQGIIRVLTRHLRNRVDDLTELRRQLDNPARTPSQEAT